LRGTPRGYPAVGNGGEELECFAPTLDRFLTYVAASRLAAHLAAATAPTDLNVALTVH
jgi:hypothetical protein